MEAAATNQVDARLADLQQVDWSFAERLPSHPLHGIHPYPAKFVPALPRRLIEALSQPGDLVLDPFCGSGTGLLEAILLGRQAVGGDLNPVAVVAARAKTQRLSPDQFRRLKRIRGKVVDLTGELLSSGTPLPLPRDWEPSEGRRFKGLKFWFDERVARELAALKQVCSAEADPDCRGVLDMCFSAIVVAVSRQDSDTRYVRREKDLQKGMVITLFVRRLRTAIAALSDLAQKTVHSATVVRCDSRDADYVGPETVQLAVTSPPYPNAWSYHLYHQNRILWLDEDPWDFKAREIGHHRSYSAAGGADQEQFHDDMSRSLACMKRALSPRGHAVVVIGDSIIRGEPIRNDRLVVSAASENGLKLRISFDRVIDPRRKAFNPAIGKIKMEHVLVFGH